MAEEDILVVAKVRCYDMFPADAAAALAEAAWPPAAAGEAEILEASAASLHPSYHDLYITAEGIPRARLFDLPYNLMVTCSRTSGWELWDTSRGWPHWDRLAAEYAEPDRWLVLDVNGIVIVDSRTS